MNSEIVYLKSSVWPGLMKHPPIMHEAAHARHYSLDGSLSRMWATRFPIERKPIRSEATWNSRSIRERYGLVEEYSAFDYNKDAPEEIARLPDSAPKLSIIRSNTRIELYGAVDSPESVIGDVVQQLNFLPANLQFSVKHLVVDPDLNMPGVFVSQDRASEEYLRTAEDVACSTVHFNCAISDQLSLRRILKLIHRSATSAPGEKLEILADFGFIDKSNANRLLDPKFASYTL